MFGKKLKDAMINAGLNQKDFAKLINIDRSLISRWILEERKPSAKNLKKISEVLNLPVSFFLDKNFSVKNDTAKNDKTLFSKINSLEKNITEMKKEIKKLKEEISALKNNNELLKKQMELLKKK